MSEPNWKLLPQSAIQPMQVVWRRWLNGKEESCLITAPEYLRWLAEGNTPLPADKEVA